MGLHLHLPTCLQWVLLFMDRESFKTFIPMTRSSSLAVRLSTPLSWYRLLHLATLHFIKAITMQTADLWHVTPYSLVEICQRSSGYKTVAYPAFYPKDVENTSLRNVDKFLPPTRRHIPEDCHVLSWQFSLADDVLPYCRHSHAVCATSPCF
jgi:hypothetical protein